MNAEKTRVLITVDTEHSIGGAFRNPALKPVGNARRIYGRFDGESYGIPLIMDIADRYGLQVIFFLEVLNKYLFGKDESREVCQYVLNRGHDVQLHLHPNYLNFTRKNPSTLVFNDNMSAYDVDRQTELIREGAGLLKEYGAKNVTAFRAGNYGADRNTLEALSRNGFRFDSSYNLTFIHKSRKITDKALNDITRIGDIFELPITCFREKLSPFIDRITPMDLNGASFEEMRETLNFAFKNGMRFVTVILHSFSFFHTRDPQYTKVCIRQDIIEKFLRLCRFLSDNPQKFTVAKFQDLPGDDAVPFETEALCLPKMPGRMVLSHYGEKICAKIRYER